MQQLSKCQTWTEVCAMSTTVESRIAIYAILAASLVHDRGGKVLLSDETLRAVLQKGSESNWTESFHVKPTSEGMEVSL